MGAIIWWIVVGLIAGALAKLIMPGRQGGGIIVTIVLGILGALLGGWIGSLLNIGGGTITSIILAVVGALILLFIYGLVTGRKGRTH
ncbi:GlsB/YeaQ/YmgE family stress response membrane protein [Kocuria turfanensis]|uniref:Membrane protein n=1 Tax=Kocuria turfanensis TaxID=388357 RepID=A0A512IAJ9_9MICC|nr:GlsB/YeaQ/YmgE family stress response membrane protein [Kocuria turfanensis]GEO94732.1 membrane protein [Kocuria turfanensis]